MALANPLSPATQITLLLALAATAGVGVVGVVRKRRSSPEKRERLRRARLAENGRLHDGVLTETNDNILYYDYEVRGVAYHAAQDVSALLDILPESPADLIGPVTLRYSLKNPANSIVIAEEWSGLRKKSGSRRP